MALKPPPCDKQTGKPLLAAAELVGLPSKEEGRRESTSAHPQMTMPGRLRMPPSFSGTTRRTGFGLPSVEASGQDSGLHLSSRPWQTSTQNQAPPKLALPSTPTRGSSVTRDVPPTLDFFLSASRTAKNSRLDLDGPPPVSAILPLSTAARSGMEVRNPQEVPPPDASVSKPLQPPREGGTGEVSTKGDSTLTRHENITDETSTQAPMPTSNAVGSSSASTKSTRKYRFQDEIDPDLLASGPRARKIRTWADLNSSPRFALSTPGEAIGSDSPLSTAWGRKKPITQAEKVATPTPAQRSKQNNLTGVPSHQLVSVNKRMRTRSSSPPIFPDTPPHKRQQQEYHRKLHAIVFVPRLPEDGIEDADTLPKLSQKRQKSDVPSSPTKSTSPVRKKQRIVIEPEDTIEDGPDSPSLSPKRIDDIGGVSSMDEVAEHTDDIGRPVGFEALLEPPPESQAPTYMTQSTGSRRLLDPDAMRRYFKATKPVPKDPPLEPGMINIIKHLERIIIPEDPTPPPASPPRRAYIGNGLAETAMWWKHDLQERHKRMFTEDRPTLTCRVLIREFLRDDKMCFIKGPGKNKDGEEGDVRVVVTERAAEAVTRKGATLLYEGPWFEISLLGEEEPYRFLIGSWRIEQTAPQKGGCETGDE